MQSSAAGFEGSQRRALRERARGLAIAQRFGSYSHPQKEKQRSFDARHRGCTDRLPIRFAASAHAAPCGGYFGTDSKNPPSSSICGTPNVKESIDNAKSNLRRNLGLDHGDRADKVANLQKNLSGHVGQNTGVGLDG